MIPSSKAITEVVAVRDGGSMLLLLAPASERDRQYSMPNAFAERRASSRYQLALVIVVDNDNDPRRIVVDNDNDLRRIDDGFLVTQLKGSLDVDCPPWMDWFHGGLQFQVEHHLWPKIPRHNLRTVPSSRCSLLVAI